MEGGLVPTAHRTPRIGGANFNRERVYAERMADYERRFGLSISVSPPVGYPLEAIDPMGRVIEESLMVRPKVPFMSMKGLSRKFKSSK